MAAIDEHLLAGGHLPDGCCAVPILKRGTSHRGTTPQPGQPWGSREGLYLRAAQGIPHLDVFLHPRLMRWLVGDQARAVIQGDWPR